MKRSSLLFMFFVPLFLFAQDTIVLRPGAEDGIDAWISDKFPSSGHGSYLEISMATWTNGMNLNVVRSLLDFNLVQLPLYSNIISAKLTLYVYNNSSNWNGTPLQGGNGFYINRVIQPWDEMAVTWNNQPGFDYVNQCTVPMLTMPADSVVIDVTAQVIDRFLFPMQNYGMMLRMQDEVNYYRVASFGSSDNPNPAKRPKLQVIYNYNVGTEDKTVAEDRVHAWYDQTGRQIMLAVYHHQPWSGTLNLFSMDGREMFSSEQSGAGRAITSVDLGFLPQGLYVMVFRGSGLLYTRKFMVGD